MCLNWPFCTGQDEKLSIALRMVNSFSVPTFTLICFVVCILQAMGGRTFLMVHRLKTTYV